MFKAKLLKSILIPTLGIFAIGSIAAVSTSCGEKNVTGVSLNKNSTTLDVGKTETLTATVLPADATDKSVTWTSDNESVATVDNNGKITAIAKGTATITAASVDNPNAKATCEVSVREQIIPVTSVSLNKNSTTLDVGKTETLTATVLPADTTDKSVTWTSDNESVATVDNNGKITAIAKGTATITAASVDNPNAKATCAVTAIVDQKILDNCVNITAIEDSTLELKNKGGNNPDLQYSTDGTNWSKYNAPIYITQGQSLYLKGNNPDGWSHDIFENSTLSIITRNASASISGNVMGLLDNGAAPGEQGDITDIPCNNCFDDLFKGSIGIKSVSKNFLPATTLANSCYAGMFQNCTSLTTAPNLPATTLAGSCYWAMYSGCSSLTTAPALPATTLAGSCYSAMFHDCTSLTTAPNLPATTLANSCYYNMFGDCTSLTTAPKLPATSLTNACYWRMFEGCPSLTTTPELPARTLANSCYKEMFHDCTSLTTAPNLPATTLADDCYREMFNGCTSLTSAPELLPATTLEENCYQEMFAGCAALKTAPNLPATRLANSCCYGMFQGCTSLTTAPELPATGLAEKNCYRVMFMNCTSLTTAPNLPATTLADDCYREMFNGCTSLTPAPNLPATTLAVNCYYGMFKGCASLTAAPELPATTLVEGCYQQIFQNCSSLNWIKIYYTGNYDSKYFRAWGEGVRDSSLHRGTLYHNGNTWTRSVDFHLPASWWRHPFS